METLDQIRTNPHRRRAPRLEWLVIALLAVVELAVIGTVDTPDAGEGGEAAEAADLVAEAP
jgi:hypothetical protein